jgi:hypothetical protein
MALVTQKIPGLPAGRVAFGGGRPRRAGGGVRWRLAAGHPARCSPGGNACSRCGPASVTRSSSPVCTPARPSRVTTFGCTTRVIPAASTNSGTWQPPAGGRDDRREVAAAEAVHQVVNPGKASLLDDGSGGREVRGVSARDHAPRDAVKSGGGDGVEFGIQRRRGRPDGERAQHLAGVLWRGRCADLSRYDVARPDQAPGRPLRRPAESRLVHGGDAQVT